MTTLLATTLLMGVWGNTTKIEGGGNDDKPLQIKDIFNTLLVRYQKNKKEGKNEET